MTNQEWKLKEKNGWNNWYSWAANLWITGNSEWTYKAFDSFANNYSLAGFTERVKDFVKEGGVEDFEEQDIEPAIENIDYKSIYEGLREE